MAELISYNEKITDIFQLFGTHENDITKSIAWTLCKCPSFLNNLVYAIIGENINTKEVIIKYQEFEKNKGITDLEITDNKLFHIVIEAKKGWELPGKEQLGLYSERKSFMESTIPNKVIVSMSECSEEYAYSNLPCSQINGIPLFHLSWRKLYEIADASRSNASISQKNILKELLIYFGGIMTMQVKESNWVYVVSLSFDRPDNCDITWVDIVEKKMRYFHPFGKQGWPKEPPNYIAFRYKGQLQSIHHIEDYTITRNLHEEIEEMPDKMEDKDYLVYKLGEAIKPQKVVKTGHIYASGRVWAMLDTLLTADTIDEARNISKERMGRK